eukprot:3205794-Amphidinium_carterae.5
MSDKDNVTYPPSILRASDKHNAAINAYTLTSGKGKFPRVCHIDSISQPYAAPTPNPDVNCLAKLGGAPSVGGGALCRVS